MRSTPPLVVTLTGGTIAVRTFLTTRQTIDALASDLFRTVSDQAIAQTRAYLLRAGPTAETARVLAVQARRSKDLRALPTYLLSVLRANPDFSWISYSDRAGAFVGAFHSSQGVFRLNQSVIRSGKTAMSEHDIDPAGNRTLHRKAEDTGYDPRTRPFYTLAAQAKARVWTPPYVFFDQGVPGITCALPDYDADGTLAGVVTVDFDLNALSRFVSGLKLGEHGRVFILAADGVVIAHPSLRLVERTGQGAQGTLVTVADVADPVLQAFMQADPTHRGRLVPFEVAGEAWRGRFTAFRVDEGLDWVVGAVAPESDFMGAAEANNRWSLLVSVLGLLGAVGIAAWLASRIATPLTELAGEMGEVGRFELRDRAPRPTVFTEIAMMDTALDRMKKGLRSFASYVPRDVVRAVIASGREAVLGGEKKTLTVFFSDIAGFTTIAETMAPDALVQWLAQYFDETTRIIAAHGGTVDKFIGDGIMAFWGAPTETPQHAVRACEAALAYQRRLAALKAQGEPWAQDLSARIGIATGEVVVGNFGSSARLNYTAAGDTVNLAARLEGLGKVYGAGILLSEATYAQAKEHVVARPVDVVAVKGKAQAVKIYELLGLASEGAPVPAKLAQVANLALDAYLGRDFGRARARYAELLELHPGDRAAAVLLSRVDAFQRTPPPAAWTGVHVVTEK